MHSELLKKQMLFSVETELDVEDLAKEEMDVESLINKLTINISMLERCNKDWTGIMKDLKGEAKATCNEKIGPPPKTVPRTNFGCQNWSPLANFGPP